jgi:NTE family protein
VAIHWTPADGPAKILLVTQSKPAIRKKVGFVLSGGGSRGAYEAGIIQYLRTDLAKRLGRHVPLDIITGTSVGAINAAFLASTMQDPTLQSMRIVDAWRQLRIEQMISLKPMDLLRSVKLLMGGDPVPPQPGSFRYGGILNTQGLERFVVRTIPWRGIERSLRSGALQALSVSTTHVGTGHTVVFLSSKDPVPVAWSRDPFVRHRAANIGPRHVLASAAIPILFPSVKIGDNYFTDGGLRQNTPMSPAIRLGADKLLVISLRHVRETGAAPDVALEREREEAAPKPLFMVGKALNALMLDHTDYDIQRMERINAILDAGNRGFGAPFEPTMNVELQKMRSAPLRRIDAVHIRPSEDIGALAAQFVAKGRMHVSGVLARKLIQRLADGESAHETDLLSYLLFDGGYAADLIDLGCRDARNQEEALGTFFDDSLSKASR